MQLKALALAALALLVPAATATTATTTMTVSYDEAYDKASSSLNTVACSDGTHGLAAKYHTLGGLPHFPNIGGAAAVAGWNSAQCGTCWQLEYKGRSVNVLAVDHAQSGFNIARGAMDALTGGQAKKLGRVQASVKQVDKSKCGL